MQLVQLRHHRLLRLRHHHRHRLLRLQLVTQTAWEERGLIAVAALLAADIWLPVPYQEFVHGLTLPAMWPRSASLLHLRRQVARQSPAERGERAVIRLALTSTATVAPVINVRRRRKAYLATQYRSANLIIVMPITVVNAGPTTLVPLLPVRFRLLSCAMRKVSWDPQVARV